MLLLSSVLTFFKIKHKSHYIIRLIIFAYGFDPDQDWKNVNPDLSPNRLSVML